jgi:hypothetical protein
MILYKPQSRWISPSWALVYTKASNVHHPPKVRCRLRGGGGAEEDRERGCGLAGNGMGSEMGGRRWGGRRRWEAARREEV